jgi:hypothetical protein
MVVAVAAMVVGVVAMHALAAGGHRGGGHQHTAADGHHHDHGAEARNRSPELSHAAPVAVPVAVPVAAQASGHEVRAVAPGGTERSPSVLAIIVASPGDAASLLVGAVPGTDGLCLHGEAHGDCPGHLHPMMTCLAVLSSAAIVVLLLLGAAVLARRWGATPGSPARTAECCPPGGWEAWRLRLPLRGPALSELCVSRT